MQHRHITSEETWVCMTVSLQDLDEVEYIPHKPYFATVPLATIHCYESGLIVKESIPLATPTSNPTKLAASTW